MATVWISFRIADRTVGGKTYDARLEALTKALHGSASKFWEETTSFLVIETTKGAGDIALKAKGAIAPDYDLVLIRSMESKAAYIVGTYADKRIEELVPYLKKV